MTASREIELKLDCDAADLAALADHPLLHSPDAGHVTLHATYYDTDAGDLRAAGLALRVRRETGPDGERVIQTVKAGADGAGLFVRAEWERTIPGPAPDRAALDDPVNHPRLAAMRAASGAGIFASTHTCSPASKPGMSGTP